MSTINRTTGARLFSVAEFAYNNSWHSVIEMSPFANVLYVGLMDQAPSKPSEPVRAGISQLSFCMMERCFEF
jgi:hypothetical protein